MTRGHNWGQRLGQRWTLLFTVAVMVLGTAGSAAAQRGPQQGQQACRPEVAAAAAVALLDHNPDATAIGDRIEAALKGCPGLVRQRGKRTARTSAWRAGVFARLQARLAAIPRRWQAMEKSIPKPSGPTSVRLGHEVIAAASQDERQAAVERTMRIIVQSARASAASQRTLGQERQLTEIDLWVPAQLATVLYGFNFELAGLFLEVSLLLGEQAGRHDILLDAAGGALWLLWRPIPSSDLLNVANVWSQLPYDPADRSKQHSAGRVRLGRAWILYDTGDNTEALAGIRAARALYQAVGDKLGQGHSWLHEARVLYFLGDHTAALTGTRTARVLYQAVGDKLGQGHSWLHEARVLYYLGDHAGALASYRTARALYQAVGDKLGQGHSWFHEARVWFRLGDHDEALAGIRAARALYQAIGDKLGQGHSWLHEAWIWSFLGDHVEALAGIRSARVVYQAIGDKLGQGNSWQNEARILFRLGNHAGALAGFRAARALYQAVGGKVGQGNSWLFEAQVLSRLNDHAGALAGTRTARGLYQAVGDKFGQGNSWFVESDVLFRLGDHAGALAGIRAARSLYQTAEDKVGQGNSWQDEAEILLHLGDYAGALAGYRTARVLYQDIGHKGNQGFSWRGEAAVLERLGRPAEARAAATAAVRLIQKHGDAYDDGELHARIVLARTLAALGQERKAIQAAEDAINVLAAWRRRANSDLGRTANANQASPYDFLVPFLARRPRHASKALYWAERAHAPVLLDLMANRAQRRQAASPPASQVSTSAAVTRLRQELLNIDRQLEAADDFHRRARLQDRRRDLDWQLELHELAAMTAQELVTGRPLTRAGINRLVKQIGPTLLYYVAEDEAVAFLLRPGQRTPLVHRIAHARAALRDRIQTLRHHLGNRLYQHHATAEARALYDLLIAPFADALANTQQLTIIPHGPLHQLPFAALRDPGGQLLFERWHLSVAPSLSALRILRRRATQRRAQKKQLAFFGLSAGTGLRFPNREVKAVAALFAGPTAISLQHRSTFASYQHNAPRARQMLISTHGIHVPHSRSGTYLEVKPSADHDSRLSAVEIARIPLQADLVTLSACDSATGEALLSDERLDITRAFLIAGASAVLATRWQIPDTAETQQFLIDFYRAWQHGGSNGRGLRKDQALTRARRQARSRGVAPNIWAAWTLIGDAR